jgi:predicted ArsR family transcriptional regulator
VATARWEKRFLESTRGRIVEMLRRASRTVDELAAALDLTDNAVRAHIATLERDGLVEQHGVRRGTSKPAFAYDLTPEAEQLFPKAYGPVLAQLLTVLAEQMPTEEFESLLRRIGHRLASDHTDPSAALASRLERAVGVLNGLGGLAESDLSGDVVTIRGYSCPLATIVGDHPAVCHLAETLVSDIVGVSMCERCEYGARPRCRFVGALPNGA